jgi:hypothetical protein
MGVQDGKVVPGATLYLLIKAYDMSLHDWVSEYLHKEGNRRVNVATAVRIIIKVGRASSGHDTGRAS